MNITTITGAFIQKGYEDAPAFSYFGEDDKCVAFTASESFYDPNAANKKGYSNWHVKAFGSVCERIKKMGLKEGSRVNLSGSFKTERWEDKSTGEKRQRMCLTLAEIEYASSGKKKSEEDGSAGDETEQAANPPRVQGSAPPAPKKEESYEEYAYLNDDDLPFI